MTPMNWDATHWLAAVEKGLSGLRELDESSPTRLVYGADYLGRLSFGFVTQKPPSKPLLSDAVTVECAQRPHDGAWTLMLRLDNPHFTDVFLRLCEDIYREVRNETDEDSGMEAAYRVLEQWRALFDLKALRRLSLDRCRGLFAELHVGFNVIARVRGLEAVVEGWQGPFGADQDFQFPDCSYEVKSKHPTTRALQIASEYQLNGENIILVTLDVEDSRRLQEGYLSLNGIIREIRSRLNKDRVHAEIFDTALQELGLDIDDDYYKSLFFAGETLGYYAVTTEFPRIIPSQLPFGVSRSTYRLDLEAIGAFAIKPELATRSFPNETVLPE